MDIVFVILNYMLVDETVNCVQHIKKNIDTDNYHIIIVDNNSKNDAGRKLKRMFDEKEDDKVEVIINDTNEGFAKGNNVGIVAARKLEPKYIICLNNDIVFEQKNFFAIIDKAYQKTKAAVLGPRIFRRDYSNGGIEYKKASKERYLKELDILTSRIKALNDNKERSNFDIKKFIFKNSRFARNIYHMRHNEPTLIEKGRHELEKEYKGIIKGDYSEDVTENAICNTLLHGSFLIFTPHFFEKLSGFYPETFLYYEEDFLLLEVEKAGLKTLYLPSTAVIHLEGSSRKASGVNDKSKLKKMYEQYISSLKLLLNRYYDLKV